MFKLLVLSVVVAVAVAAPSGIHGYGPLTYAADWAPEYHVSKVIEHVPTAVSHQSRIDYHSKPIITPIYAPVIKSVPIIHSAPVLHAAPIHHAPILHHSAPILHHSAPILHSSPWLDAHAWK